MSERMAEVKISAQNIAQSGGKNRRSGRRGTRHGIQQPTVPEPVSRDAAVGLDAHPVKDVLAARVKGMQQHRKGIGFHIRRDLSSASLKEAGMPLQQEPELLQFQANLLLKLPEHGRVPLLP